MLLIPEYSIMSNGCLEIVLGVGCLGAQSLGILMEAVKIKGGGFVHQTVWVRVIIIGLRLRIVEDCGIASLLLTRYPVEVSQ